MAKRPVRDKNPKGSDKPTAELGAVIRERRKALGLSQQEVADLSGVSINLLRQIEAGKPTAYLSKVLDVMSAVGLQFSVTPGRARIEIKV